MNNLGQKNVNIDLGTLFKLVWLKKYYILALTLIAGMGTYFYFSMQTKSSYRVETDIYIIAKDGTGEQNPIQYLQLADAAVKDYEYLVKADYLIEDVAKQYQISNINDIKSGLSVTLSQGTRSVKVALTMGEYEKIIDVFNTLLDKSKVELLKIANIKDVYITNRQNEYSIQIQSVNVKKVLFITGIILVGLIILTVLIYLFQIIKIDKN